MNDKTEETIEAFPLSWPIGRKRSQRRERSRFRVALAKARDKLINELKLLGAQNVVISSNIPTKRNGVMYAVQSQPDDPAVAVYFLYKKRHMCFACDRWNRIEDNIQAICQTISALRGIARWGTGDMLESAFTGFAALPNPDRSRSWREVLGVSDSASNEEVKQQYRKLRSIHHPDKGGDAKQFDEIEKAFQKANEVKS